MEINIDIQFIRVNYDDNVLHTITIDWGDYTNDTGVMFSGDGTWIKGSLSGNTYSFKTEYNLTEHDRSTAITFFGYDANNKYSAAFCNVEQLANTSIPTFNYSAIEIDFHQQVATTIIQSRNAPQMSVIQYPSWVSNVNIQKRTLPQGREYTEEWRLIANVNENNAADRDGFIHLKSGVYNFTLPITQKSKNIEGNSFVLFDNDLITFDYNQQTVKIPFQSNDVKDLKATSSEAFATINFINNNEINISLNENIDVDARYSRINLKCKSLNSDIDLNTSITLKQTAAAEAIDFPIWKDTDITIESSNEYVDYKFYNGAECLYTGRAFIFDGKATIRVNEVLRDFVISKLDFTSVDASENIKPLQNSSYYQFTMKISFDDFDTEEDYLLLRTWYDYSYNEEKEINLSNPISNILDSRQYLLFTVMSDYLNHPLNIETLYYQQATGPVRPPQRLNFTLSNETMTFVKKLNVMSDEITRRYIINDYMFEVKNTCYPYAVYYLNKKGGYESMLFNRTMLQTDNLKFNTITNKVANTSTDFSKRIYHETITERFNLHSEFLTDEQAEKMTEMFGSPQIWLHDLEKDKVIPCIVSDTNVKYLNWANNKKKKVRFDITLENSQEKIRR